VFDMSRMQGDLLSFSVHLSLVSFLSTILVAEMLMGSGFLQTKVGRVSVGLESCSTADFASVSACSLLSIPSWPGVQMKVISHHISRSRSFHPMLPLLRVTMPLPLWYPTIVCPWILAWATWKSLIMLRILSVK
jgi:hypothetical protein